MASPPLPAWTASADADVLGAAFTSTRAFGVRRDCPSMTTCSPGSSPLSIVVMSPVPTDLPTDTGRTLAILSFPTTNT